MSIPARALQNFWLIRLLDPQSTVAGHRVELEEAHGKQPEWKYKDPSHLLKITDQ